MAAAPGAKIQDEGRPGAADAKAVQGYLDAAPKVFAARAHELELASAKLMTAAAAHDAAAFSAVSNNLDKLCENCHLKFWYPKLKK